MQYCRATPRANWNSVAETGPADREDEAPTVVFDHLQKLWKVWGGELANLLSYCSRTHPSLILVPKGGPNRESGRESCPKPRSADLQGGRYVVGHAKHTFISWLSPEVGHRTANACFSVTFIARRARLLGSKLVNLDQCIQTKATILCMFVNTSGPVTVRAAAARAAALTESCRTRPPGQTNCRIPFQIPGELISSDGAALESALHPAPAGCRFPAFEDHGIRNHAVDADCGQRGSYGGKDSQRQQVKAPSGDRLRINGVNSTAPPAPAN